jgi:5'-nucleotidase
MNRLARQGLVVTLTGALALLVLTIAPLSAQAAVACTPAETITGTSNGAINVAGGQTLCLDNATQTGAITVDPNGTLSVRGSTIEGAVSLSSGFTQFEFCGSETVGGAIEATGGTGPVLIGNTGLLGPDGAPACAANIIDGAVTLDANHGGVTLARNDIGDAVTASANGNVDTSVDTPTNIVGNSIAGALTCTGNTPAPNNLSLLMVPESNVVGGERFGQTCLDGKF